MQKFLSAALLLFFLTGCASSRLRSRGATVPLRVQLNRQHSVNFAGYYQAEEQGFYASHGLRVSLLPGGTRGETIFDPAEILLSGQSEFAVLSFAQYQRIAADERQPLVVLATFQISPLVFISFQEQGIERIQDMYGKRVAIPSPDWQNVVNRVLENVGMSPEDITQVSLDTPEMDDFYRQRVDVWPGYLTDEGVQVLLDGYRVNTIFASNYGWNTYEGLLVTTQPYASAHPENITALVDATLEGWHYTFAHPRETASLLAARYPEHSRLYYELGLEYLRPLVDTGEVPLGWIDYTRWRTLLNLSDTNFQGYDMRFVETAHLQE